MEKPVVCQIIIDKFRDVYDCSVTCVCYFAFQLTYYYSELDFKLDRDDRIKTVLLDKNPLNWKKNNYDRY